MTLFERFAVATLHCLAQRLSRESRTAVAEHLRTFINLFHEIGFHSDLYGFHSDIHVEFLVDTVHYTECGPGWPEFGYRPAESHLTGPACFENILSMKRIAPLLLLLVFAGGVRAQEVAPEALLGTFEGPLVIGRDSMTLAFTFSLNGGELRAQLFSAAMGIYGMPADSVSINENALRIAIQRLDLEFTGRLRFDESGQIQRIDGDWFQYSEMVPVILLPVEAPSF